MGAWGPAPWENDSAADWFDDTITKGKLGSRVEKTLRLDPEEYYEEIRAAAHLVLLLGRTYVWPEDTLSDVVDLAVKALSAVKDADVYENEDILALVDEEIAALKQRQKDLESGDD